MKKFYFVFIFVLYSNLNFAQNFQPFNWQFPQYGSHAINCTRWITGQKFIAVGDAGAMLLSNDDGATWQRIEPFTAQKFRSVFIKDSLTFFAVASHDNGLGELYKTTDGGNNWVNLYNVPNRSFRDIHFPNDSIGYIVGYPSFVAKTTDYGDTWQDISSIGILSGTLTSVSFLNSDTGFVGKTTTTAAMFKTENGGLTWSQVFGYGGQACYTIKFLNDTLGYAGAYNSRIFRTTNGGATWAQQTTFQTNEEVTAIDFADSTHGVAVTNSYVYRTSNGINWSGPFVGGPNFISAAFSPNGSLVLGDSYGGLRTASNFGTSYVNSNSQSGLFNFKRIKFADAQNGWVMGEGYNFLKTTNGGATWTSTNPTYYVDYVNDMAVLSPNKVVIVAGDINNSGSKVITTTNGGSTYTEQVLSTNGLNAVSFPSATNGYIVGNSGVAFKTTNGGTSYTPITTGITNNHTEVFFVTNQLGFVVSEWGDIRKTINSGNTWSQLNISGMGTTKQIYFTDISNGYTVNENGAVFRTTDGGNTFNSVGQTCLQTPFDMQFINDSTGFVVGSFVNASCDVSYTTNYGQTWNSIVLPFEYAVWGVYAMDTANIYLVGQNQSIIKIGTNGVVTSVQKNDESLQPDFQIFPNPTDGILTIKNSNKEKIEIEIFDISGKLILKEMQFEKSFSADMSGFQAGMYFVKISTSGASKSYKISKY
ncbi:MAG TPA: YCF48-related protein [Bacteroidia bacterium]|nr:YCF48-related protein [Bacteroidia bacterium]